MQPRPRLILDADLSGQTAATLKLMATTGGIRIRFGTNSRPIRALMVSSTLNINRNSSSGIASFIPNPERLTICNDRRARLASVTFHVMNFPAFLSQGDLMTDLIHESQPGKIQRLGRSILKHAGWRIELQSIPHSDDLIKQLNVNGGYALTHVGLIERTDGRTFWISQAEDILRDIHYFLSFARGLWVPTILPVGLDRSGKRIYEEWGFKLGTAWEPCRSWFDTHNGQSLGELFPGFSDLLNHPDLGEPTKAALYWYLRSNRAGEGAGVDSGIILSQAALERLTSAYLTWAGLSQSGTATQRFQRAFKHLGLPINIPREISALAAAQRKGAWKDMPDCLVKVRNELIHPKAQLSVKVGKVVADVWNTAQWYIELCILRLAGYRGFYSHRLRARWRGEVEQVPWVR